MLVFVLVAVMMISVHLAVAEEKDISNLQISTALKCKGDFTLSVLTSLQTQVPSAGVSAMITKLTKDVQQLQTLDASGNSSELRTFVKMTYDSDLKAGREAIRAWRTANRGNLTKEQRSLFKRGYEDARGIVEGCQFAALKTVAVKRIAHFTDELARYDATTAKLASAGLDVILLKKVTDDARTQVVTLLQTTLDAAKTADDIKNVFKKYCLYNGCPNGFNYHLAARYNIEKEQLLLNTLKSRNDSNIQSTLSQAETAIMNARGVIAELAGAQYPQEGRVVWGYITDAHQLLSQARGLNLEKKSPKNRSNLS